jgi:hypothetical protein
MAKNSLGLKSLPIYCLKVGQSCLVGPFRNPTTAATNFTKVRNRPGCEGMQWTQRQLLLVDPTNGTCHKMYLITRTE